MDPIENSAWFENREKLRRRQASRAKQKGSCRDTNGLFQYSSFLHGLMELYPMLRQRHSLSILFISINFPYPLPASVCFWYFCHDTLYVHKGQHKMPCTIDNLLGSKPYLVHNNQQRRCCPFPASSLTPNRREGLL